MANHPTIQSAHLTDEQFADLLLGLTSSSVQAHLDVCPQCAEESERVSGAIGSFEQQTRLWAERRAAAQPALESRRQPGFAWLLRPQAWTAAALTIALAAGFGVSLRNHRAPAVQSPVAQVQSPAEVSPATLKTDNDLLSAIDGELRADDSASASAYGLTVSTPATRTKPAKRIVNE